MSLAVSTSETMQPHGPLAQLTNSAPDAANLEADARPPSFLLPSTENEPSFAQRRQLGPAFTARSYGPSSSTSLAAVLGLNNGPPRQSHTVGPRRALQSPVRLSRSSTQKRRSKHNEEARKRPALASDVFTAPSPVMRSMSEMGRQAQFSSTSSGQHDSLFVPRAPVEPIVPAAIAPDAIMAHLAPPVVAPPRLGSPFSGQPSSFSFPNRFTQPMNLDMAALGRPFATVQQPAEAPAAPVRSNLASRLAYIDQRLKELNKRDPSRPRSESPF